MYIHMLNTPPHLRTYVLLTVHRTYPTFVHPYIRKYIHMYVCMYVCMYICMYVCMYWLSTSSHLKVYVYTTLCLHAVCMYIYIILNAHIVTYIHTYVHSVCCVWLSSNIYPSTDITAGIHRRRSTLPPSLLRTW